MFENQPKGLWALALANTGERFGYYTMLAVFLLYLQANFGFETGLASTIYSTRQRHCCHCSNGRIAHPYRFRNRSVQR